jgi:hypothetical protein
LLAGYEIAKVEQMSSNRDWARQPTMKLKPALTRTKHFRWSRGNR